MARLIKHLLHFMIKLALVARPSHECLPRI